MKFTDLREFLDKIDEVGELKRVDGADPKTEIGPITEIAAWTPQHPAILFDDIKGFPKGFRILSWPFNRPGARSLFTGSRMDSGAKSLSCGGKNGSKPIRRFRPKRSTAGP